MVSEETELEPPDSDYADDGSRRPAGRTAVLVGLLALPMVVATAVLSHPTWYAHDDFALTEMRLRDVTSTSPPLVGLAGRIEHDGVPGSHPGPMSFYLLTPLYRLFGSSSWAMHVATAGLGLTAVGLAVWIGRRRGGPTGMLAVATGMATLLVAYGPERWIMPWNPSLPLLWWPVVLLAAWSVLCRDGLMAVVFIVAASFCAQTHVSYVGLVAGLAVVVVASAVWAGWRDRAGPDRAGRHDGPAAPSGRGRGATWLIAGGALLVVLWVPPIIDQILHDPGNASVLVGQFLDADEAGAGWATAVDVTVDRFDPVAILAGRTETADASPGGIVVLVAWAAAAAVAWRRRLPADLVRLHAVVAVATILGLTSVSRIQGPLLAYLTLWLWGTAAVMVAATIWTAVVATGAVGREAAWPARGDGRVSPAVSRRALLPGLLAVAVVVACVDAARAGPQEAAGRLEINAEVFPEAFDALGAGVDRFGPDDRYFVRALDTYTAGLSAFTVLNEMERRGFDAGVDPDAAVSTGRTRTLKPVEATAIVTYAAGPAIDLMRAEPDAIELAHADVPPDTRAAAASARENALDALERAGVDDAAARLDANAFGVAVGEDVPEEAAEAARAMLELGGPVALFVSPAPGG